jgi:4-amino-4-deoxy-L-arabinose transferase-like glycosyltransferase
MRGYVFKRAVIIKPSEGLFPLLGILGGYIALVASRYWMLPVTSDGLGFCFYSTFPQKVVWDFERFFNFYIGKLFTFHFNNLLQGFATLSFLYHVGIIVFAFLIARKLGGEVQGILAAILTASYPAFFIWATEYFTDVPCLFFGLGALYFSLMKEGDSHKWFRSLLCGLFLTGSVFSKLPGMMFAIPVLINLCPFRATRKIYFFVIGILSALLFVAICDAVFIRDFFYHLNPRNYLHYFSSIKTKIVLYMNAEKGKPFMIDLLDPKYLTYFIFFIISSIQAFLFIERRKDFKWKMKGVFGLLITGLSVAFIYIRTDIYFPGYYFFEHYYYCLFIPWIVAFCSSLGFSRSEEKTKGFSSKTFFVCLTLCVFYIAILVNTTYLLKDSMSSRSVRNFLFFSSLWIFAASLIVIVITGNTLRRREASRAAVVLFILGCLGLCVHYAYSIDITNSLRTTYNKTVRTLLKTYESLSKNHPVILFDCNVPRNDEIRMSLLLSKLAKQDDFACFSKDAGLKEIVQQKKTSVYIFSKEPREALMRALNNLDVEIVLANKENLFGCQFYFIEKDQKNRISYPAFEPFKYLIGRGLENLVRSTSFLRNASFESWSRGPRSIPDGFGSNDLLNDAMVFREENDVPMGRYAARIVGDEYNFGQEVPGAIKFRGLPLTLFVWMKSDTSGKYRIQIYDGFDSSLSKPHSGMSNWEILQVSHVVNAAASFILIRVVQSSKTEEKDAVVHVDGALLVGGIWNTIHQYLQSLNATSKKLP